MTAEFIGLLAVYLAVLLAIAPILGRYIRIVMENGQSRLTAWGRPLERGIYRLAGIDPRAEMGWKRYALAVLAVSVLGVAAVYALQRLQGLLPLNPAGLGAVSPDSSLNTAISFVTNTNWQGYGGESTMSYLTQMLAMTVQNFVSAATGISVLFALIRGLARHCSATLGNFWADLVRCTLYLLLPLSLVLALALVSQGVIQNFSPIRKYRPSKPCTTTSRAPTRRGCRYWTPKGWPPPTRPRPGRRRWRWDPWPRRKPSRCWAPTAAASSTPTRPTRSKTRLPCRTSWKCWRSS